MRQEIYHINSHSSKAVFRAKEDFELAINRLAVCAMHTHTNVLAYCFMSTHFHMIVRTSSLEEFVENYKRSITKLLNKRAGRKGSLLQVSNRVIMDQSELLIALNYVLKNPVHHNVSITPFSYPYSSINCYFREELLKPETMRHERTMIKCYANDLDCSTYRTIFGTYKAADSFEILSYRLVNPISFVDVHKTTAIYDSVRNFLYQINKPLSEEIELFKSNNNQYLIGSSAISLAGKLMDWDVCKWIDSEIYPKKIGALTEQELSRLRHIAHSNGIDKFQFERCS